jgi:hypothetical protein
MALAERANKLRKRQRSMPRFSTVERLDATNKKCGRMGAHPAASAWGASGWALEKKAYREAMWAFYIF